MKDECLDLMLNDVCYLFETTLVSKDYFDDESLKRHSSLHQESNSIYHCKQCNNAFEDEIDLECHIEVVHITPSDETSIEYDCMVCDGEFDGKERRVS